jgi:transposase
VQQKRHNRERRLARYEQAVALARQGKNRWQIARELGLDRRTVRRWLRAGGFPERKSTRRSSSLDAYLGYLEGRLQQGCRNAAQLWRDLREQGFRGQPGIVRRWLRQRLGPRAERALQVIQAPPPLRASPRHVAWLLLTEPQSARPYLDQLYRRAPHIATTAQLAREFFRMVRGRDCDAWPAWLEAAIKTPLANFAKHLSRDRDAVLAALRLPWSNGAVEGHIHRLKLIKRQMYGRASFDLLGLRVLHAAQQKASQSPRISHGLPSPGSTITLGWLFVRREPARYGVHSPPASRKPGWTT